MRRRDENGRFTKKEGGKMGKIVTLLVVGSITAFFLLPILFGTPLPTTISPSEIGKFLGGLLGYWRDVLFSLLKAINLVK